MATVAPPNLPTDRSNGTVTFNDHALNHNTANNAVNQLVANFNDHLIEGNPHEQYLTEPEADDRYLLKSYVPPAPDLSGYYTKTQSDARYATPTNLASAISAHEGASNPHPGYATDADLAAVGVTADTRYLQLTGGSVMTGLLGPSATNLRDLGTAPIRWRTLYAVSGDFDTAPVVAGSPLVTQAVGDTRYRLASVPVVAADSALRTYIQQIMAVIDPGGPPPPPP